MPLKSEAQRRYLNWKFGHAWTVKHGYDTKGPLPERKTHRRVSLGLKRDQSK